MKLKDVIELAAARMQNVSIEVDTAYETVCISEAGHDDIFMQGDDARQFITEAEELYNKDGDVSMDDCYACLAEPYCECIWE